MERVINGISLEELTATSFAWREQGWEYPTRLTISASGTGRLWARPMPYPGWSSLPCNRPSNRNCAMNHVLLIQQNYW